MTGRTALIGARVISVGSRPTRATSAICTTLPKRGLCAYRLSGEYVTTGGPAFAVFRSRVDAAVVVCEPGDVFGMEADVRVTRLEIVRRGPRRRLADDTQAPYLAVELRAAACRQTVLRCTLYSNASLATGSPAARRASISSIREGLRKVWAFCELLATRPLESTISARTEPRFPASAASNRRLTRCFI